ncbi:MAG: hypothetical protein WDN47_05175 [Candidatus Doudnabacteria bacterium]
MIWSEPTATELHGRRARLSGRIRKIGAKATEAEIRAELPLRVQQALSGWSLRKILVADEGELMRVGNFGRKSLYDLRDVLWSHGLMVHLGPSKAADLGFK